MDISQVVYCPVVRTRAAEMKGLANVSNFGDRRVLPVFELSRSRRSKSNPEGGIAKNVGEVCDLMGGAPFVVDLTSLESLLNTEIDRLLDPSNTFGAWRKYVLEKTPQTAIPVVHLTEPFDRNSAMRQAKGFLEKRNFIAIRIPSEFDDVEELASALLSDLGGLRNVVVLSDVGMVTPRGRPGALARVSRVAEIFQSLKPAFFCTVASSFPSSVTQLGGDDYGSFDLQEVFLSSEITKKYAELKVVHGDNACVHPADFEGVAMNWVPRVDVPLDSSLCYFRYRREDGGYVRAAKMALDSPFYEPLSCWAHSNIEDASKGEPQGRSPAHWISVRVNYHVERQLKRLAG